MSLIGDGEYKPLNRSGRILALFFGPWGIPLLLLIGWGPLSADQILADIFGDTKYAYATFAMVWGLSITLISTVCALLLVSGLLARVLTQLVRRYFLRNRE